MTIGAFQQFIYERYFEQDSARGVPATFLWFSEEVGELAHALGKRQRGDGDDANLREEFADVMAWLATLANITGVDLEAAIRDKYMTGPGPQGVK